MGYERFRIKATAKRRLSGRMGFCAALAAVWLLCMVASGNLTAPFLPSVPLDRAGIITLMEAPLEPFLNMEAPQVIGLALVTLLWFILRTPFTVGMAAVYLWLSKEDRYSVKAAAPDEENEYDAPGWQWQGWKKLLPFYAAPGQWTNILCTELIRKLLEILYMLPGAACLLFALFSASEGIRLVLAVLSLALTGLGFVGLGAYAQTRYLLAGLDGPAKPAEIIRQSARNMKGRLWDFAFFRAGFLIWFIFMQITMLIGGLFVVPYYEMSLALYMRNIMQK
jgi:hypothetical protein